jgi:oligopeptide transport system substrate-binding protein
VANNLDYLDTIPPDQLVGEAFKDDLPDRWLQRESGRFTNVTFSPWDPQMKNVELRKALSMAIDRNLIADKVFNGTVSPATGWVSPVVDGYKAGACGDACIFDAAKAKAAYDAAGGYKGTLTMTYNADNAINKAYSEAICNSIKNAVGADCRAVPTVDFATFQKKLDAKELKGMFRQGWVMDYPSIENFLSPIYSKGAIGNGGSNYSEYNNPAFEKLLAQAAAAKSSDEANGLYQQAEALLGKDMPTAPLWYPKTTVGFSDKVTNVKVDPFENLDLVAIQTK